MGKIFLFIWNLVAIALLLFGILVLLAPNLADPRDIILELVAISLVVSLLVTWFALRGKMKAGGRFMLVTWMGILTGAAFAAILLFWGVTRYLSQDLVLISIIASLACFLVFMIICRRRVITGVVLMVIFVASAVFTVYSVSSQQLNHVRETANTWKENGWPMQVEEVFPKPVSTEQCQSWFDLMSYEEDESLKTFYRESVRNLSREAAESFGNRARMKEVISASGITQKPEWEQLVKRNGEITRAMKECPHVQWFDPVEYSDKIWVVPLPKLLHTIDWARGMLVQSFVMAEKGKDAEAFQLCRDMALAADRFQIQGQILINSLIAVAIKKMAAVGIAGVQVMSGMPFPEESMEWILLETEPDPAWARGFYDSERYAVYQIYEQCPVNMMGSDVSMEEFILPFKPLWRAWMKPHSEKDLNYFTEMTRWFYTVPDYEKGSYAWHDGHVMMTGLSGSYFAPNLTNAYARLVTQTAQWRLLNAQNQVIRYYRKHRRLPDDTLMSAEEWPVDPFNDLPIKFRKIDRKHFIVYSVGPDEEDQGGEPLYVYGILETDTPQDVGFDLELN